MRKIYVKNSIIECELVVYGLEYIEHCCIKTINKSILKIYTFEKLSFIILYIFYFFPNFFNISSSYFRDIKLINPSIVFMSSTYLM